MRIRTIKPEWLQDERVCLLSSDARVLSIALILMADDHGNGRAHPRLLAGQVFPGLDASVAAAAMDELEAAQFARRYVVDGQTYYAIRNWSKHQRIDNAGAPRVPPPPEPSAEPCGEPPRTAANDGAPRLDQEHRNIGSGSGSGPLPLQHARAREAAAAAADGWDAEAGKAAIAATERPPPAPEPWVRVLRIFEGEWSAKHGSELGLHSGQQQRARAVALWAQEHVGPSGDWEAAVAQAAKQAAAEIKADAKSPWAVFAAQPGKFATAGAQAKREADAERRKVRELMLMEQRREALSARRYAKVEELDAKLAEVRSGTG